MGAIYVKNIKEELIPSVEKSIKEIDSNIIIINEDEEIYINDNIEKIKIKNINYINTEDRRIAYHLTNKKIVYSKTIQTNFHKEVEFLANKDYMKYAAQAILINIINVKNIDKRDSSIYFNNGDSIRIPKARLEEIYNLWKE